VKVIIPLAGYGKRLRPQTWSKPKPLINVAGKPILGHILDIFAPMEGIEDVVFIVGWLGEQIEEYVRANYRFRSHYVVQEELKGQAHAIHLAREFLTGPCIILFVDTLFEADLSNLDAIDADAVAFVKEVEDPRRFGVVVEENGHIVRIIEKPEGFEHRNAVVGLYYVREGRDLERAIEYLLEHDIQTKGEFYLADAFQVMIDRGAHFVSRPVSVWEDCGEPGTVLHTNRYLLEHGHAREVETVNAVLIPPVHIADGARIESAVVGPHVTVAAGATVRNAIVRDAIIDEGALVEGVLLEGSLVGRHATLRGGFSRLNVGDDAVIE
jgi:glucose-1-phosphate thymidylyltransferase